MVSTPNLTYPILCIMGPTASGKTALALALLQQLAGEIISVDSALVYRGMDIGTAKPNHHQLQQVPHHLIDIVAPTACYSAADFCRDANVAINASVSRGKLPVLVGGTMLYFKALQQGLAPLPVADPKLRQQLTTLGSQQGLAFLHQQLAQVDAQAAAKINPHDAQRIQRALEVYYLTGKPLSQHWQEATYSNSHYHFINIALMPHDRLQLHQCIAKRFMQMLNHGFLEEVQQLQAQYHLTANLPAMRTVGYRQVWQYLAGEYDFTTLTERGIAATRQLAKRQMTWLRHWPSAHYVDPFQANVCQQVLAYLASLEMI